jgi:hypothetical protein
MDFLEFLIDNGYNERYRQGPYVVLKDPDGDTKLYDTKTRIVTGGRTIIPKTSPSAPYPPYKSFSDEN